MIIGNPIIIGGGLTATIVVSAPTGSIVSCTTPDGIVMTVTEVSGTWTFAHLGAYGTYTITSTTWGITKTTSVLVDMATQYRVRVPILPSGYQEVEYLQSSGGQWMDTGLSLTDGGIVIETNITPLDANSGTVFHSGQRATDGYKDNGIYANSNLFNIYSNAAGSMPTMFTFTAGTAYDLEAKISNGERYLKVNGTLISRDTPTSINPYSGQMSLFCSNWGDYGHFRSSLIRLKRTKITQGSTVRLYIPCKNASNVGGFYDVVAETFNYGSGGFTVGSNVY